MKKFYNFFLLYKTEKEKFYKIFLCAENFVFEKCKIISGFDNGFSGGKQCCLVPRTSFCSHRWSVESFFSILLSQENHYSIDISPGKIFFTGTPWKKYFFLRGLYPGGKFFYWYFFSSLWQLKIFSSNPLPWPKKIFLGTPEIFENYQYGFKAID